jgi:aerobic-type carbon monoxide dehydrogenase small subunit (CoxS/CutS family)
VSGRVTLTVDGRAVTVAAGASVAAAGVMAFRHSVTGAARAPLCGMGICHECRVTIDGEPHRLACQTACVEGMRVETASAGAVAGAADGASTVPRGGPA